MKLSQSSLKPLTFSLFLALVSLTTFYLLIPPTTSSSAVSYQQAPNGSRSNVPLGTYPVSRKVKRSSDNGSPFNEANGLEREETIEGDNEAEEENEEESDDDGEEFDKWHHRVPAAVKRGKQSRESGESGKRTDNEDNFDDDDDEDDDGGGEGDDDDDEDDSSDQEDNEADKRQLSGAKLGTSSKWDNNGKSSYSTKLKGASSTVRPLRRGTGGKDKTTTMTKKTGERKRKIDKKQKPKQQLPGKKQRKNQRKTNQQTTGKKVANIPVRRGDPSHLESDEIEKDLKKLSKKKVFSEDDEDDDEDSEEENISDEQPKESEEKKKGKKNAAFDTTRLAFSEEICADIRCQANEYCFIPAPGIAECLPKPSYETVPPNVRSQSYPMKTFEKMIDEAKSKRQRLRVAQARKPSHLNDDEDYTEETEPEDDDEEEECENCDDYVDDNQESRSPTVKKRKSSLPPKATEPRIPDFPPEAEAPKFNSSKILQCPSCPFGGGQMICASDNSSYSSMCRLEFHNCIHKTAVRFACFGFCPCLRVYEKVLIKPKSPPSQGNSGNSINRDTPSNGAAFRRNSLKEAYYKQQRSSGEKGKAKKAANQANEVLQRKKDLSKYRYRTAGGPTKECSMEQLRSMGLRLLDWFQVVMKEEAKHQGAKPASTTTAPPFDLAKWRKSLSYANLSKSLGRKRSGSSSSPLTSCEPPVSFMFSHFDTDTDGRLSLKELYYLEQDENEHCLEPYLTQCDTDQDQYLSAGEWCDCFSLKAKPCLYHVKHLQAEAQKNRALLGAYVPQCTAAGHYEKLQCHKGTAYCWCADKNGNEIAGTRVRGHHPTCDKIYPLVKNRATSLNTGKGSQAVPGKMTRSEVAPRRTPTTAKPKIHPKPTTKAPPADLLEDLEDGDDDDDAAFNLDQGSGSTGSDVDLY